MRALGRGILTEVFRTEVDFEQVLYRLALHAQSLFTAAACLGRAQVVLPGGDSAADLASATLLKLLDPLDTRHLVSNQRTTHYRWGCGIFARGTQTRLPRFRSIEARHDERLPG